MKNVQWTPEQEDEMIEKLLNCNDEVEIDRFFIFWSRQYNREGKLGNREGWQWLRRRATRCYDYKGPVNENSRRWRGGLPFTWAEYRIFEWAFDKQWAESKQVPTIEYVANLLQRPIEEVEKEKKRRTSTRFGIKGFFE